MRLGSGSASTAPFRETSIRRCCSGRSTGCLPPPTKCSRARAAVPATSSTSVTVFCRRRRSSTCKRLRDTFIKKLVAETGVLLMAHGTPSSMEEMPEYLRLVRGGRPASEELVAEMRHNYEAIGGRSPLTDLTLAQADALRGRLGSDVPVAVGMRNWRPFIKDALAGLAGAGVTRAIGIPMAPQFSTLSVQKYIDAAERAPPAGIDLDPVQSLHTHPLLLDALAGRVWSAQPQPA